MIITQTKSIKTKRAIVTSLIQNYILNKGDKHKINISKLKKLLKLINNGLLFKIISCNDFTFEKNHNIKDIKGIYFSDRQYRSRSRVIFENSFNRVRQDLSSIDHDSLWDDYDCHLSNKIFTIGKLWEIFVNEFYTDNTSEEST